MARDLAKGLPASSLLGLDCRPQPRNTSPIVTQKIYSHQLANGFTLVAEEMDWLESAAFSLIVPAGCMREDRKDGGLANLTCELVERGAGSRDSRQLVADLENLGADCSGTCGNSHSSFGGAMPAESLPAVLGIYADVVRRPHLPSDQLEDARQACLQEVRAREDDLAQRAMIRLREEYYGDPWGRSCHGTVESLTAQNDATVRKFFETHYRPSETILSVAGKIDWPALKDHVEGLFGDWSGVKLPLPAEKSSPQHYSHISADSSQTHIGIAFRGQSYADKDYFSLRGAVGVLGDGMSSRLFTEVREKRGLAYTVYASCHSLRDRGAVLAYAGTTGERAQETLDVLLEELTKLSQGVQADELSRLKGRIKRALILQQESSPARASNIAADWYYLGRVRTRDELGQMVDQLTCEKVNDYLKDHPPGNFTIVSLGAQPLTVGERFSVKA